MNTFVPLLLGSAAIGALVSSIITLAGQHLERKARRRELLLSESVKMAMAHRESLIKLCEMQRKEMFIPEQARLVQTYFAAMSHLVIEGRLPKGMYTHDSREDQEAFRRQFED